MWAYNANADFSATLNCWLCCVDIVDFLSTFNELVIQPILLVLQCFNLFLLVSLLLVNL